MTPEQLEKANQLNKKIALSKKHLEFMKQSASASDANNVPVTNFSINYNGGVGNIKAISFAPEWIQNEQIKKDTQSVLQHLRDELIKLFQYDIEAMENELANI